MTFEKGESDDLIIQKDIKLRRGNAKRHILLYECAKKARRYETVEIVILDGNKRGIDVFYNIMKFSHSRLSFIILYYSCSIDSTEGVKKIVTFMSLAIFVVTRNIRIFSMRFQRNF